MNEMLGNQYFLARRFEDATTQFERALLLDPNNDEVKKKLILCYLQLKEIHLALKIFTDLISKNIEILFVQDIKNIECLCMQMINEIEKHPYNLTEYEKDSILGILWTYCNLNSSRKYFTKLLELDPQNLEYQKINKILINTISQQNKGTQNGKERYYS